VEQPVSEYQKAWRRFCRNHPALAGLFFIAAAVFVAIFGYALAPDHAPDANTQIPELALRPPGARAHLLPIRLAREVPVSSWFSFVLNGQPARQRWVPIEPNSFVVKGDSAHFQVVERKNAAERVHLAQLFFAVADSVSREGDFYVFGNLEGKKQRVPCGDVLQKARAEDLIKTRVFVLGTDKYGRCMLSRLLLGFRVSLLVGLIAVFISLSIGLSVGALGGYFGGRTDDAVMLVVNTVWSIPTLLLVFAIVLALGRGIGIIFLAVGLTMWVDVARVVRGQVIALRGLPFVEAAQSMGFGWGRILFRHVLPNLLGPVMVVAAGNFATAILVESGLSYLGFGVQPPAPSWGTMLNENYGYALGGKPLLALAPALAIALTVLAFNLVGNGLRDALDVKGG
jgi:peptide/nickel transport system permease protein